MPAKKPAQTRKSSGKGGKAALSRAPVVPGSQGPARPFVYMPRSAAQEHLLRSRDALYGRATYYSGETTSNMPTYPGSGLNPKRIASIYTEVITTGRVLAKADMDDQVMRRDTHLRAVDRARIAAVVGKQVMTQPANETELARDLAYLAQVMIEDIDNFDQSCGRILKSNSRGFSGSEVWYENKALRIPGSGLVVPGAWPQQIDEIDNRAFQFEPVKNRPSLRNPDGTFTDIRVAPHKIIFHESDGEGPSRMRGHLTCTVWPHIIKHDGLARLAQCLDFYGIPHPYADIPWDQWQNEELKQATKEAMAEFGSGQPYVKAAEVLWKFTDTPAGLDARGMHGHLWGLCCTEQSKAVQGETLTTELGGVGSYNASETHADVKADIVALDERGLASTVRRWIREVFRLNMMQICRVFGRSPDEIMACIPRVYWLIHRAMDPEVRQRMRFAAVAAGLAIDQEQEYRENGWLKPTMHHRHIPGEAVIVPDGAQSAGAATAAQGVDNPRDDQGGTAATPGSTSPGLELTPSAQAAVIQVNEARRIYGLPNDPNKRGQYIGQAMPQPGAMSRRGAVAALSALSAVPTQRSKRVPKS